MKVLQDVDILKAEEESIALEVLWNSEDILFVDIQENVKHIFLKEEDNGQDKKPKKIREDV